MARKDAKSGKGGRQSARQRKQKKLLVWVAVLAVLAGGVGWYTQRQANLPGESIESMGRLHVPNNTPSPKYNSNPPTSGPHANAGRWGEYSSDIPEINQVHNLEHGGILIQYNCARLSGGQSCGDVRSALQAIMRKARDEHGRRFILAPYAKMPHPIAVTAWTWLQSFDRPDEAAILAFADAHYNNAPEDVP